MPRVALDGWDGRELERGSRASGYVYILLIFFLVQQKLKEYCKATLTQFF